MLSKSEATKRNIFEASLKLFTQKGYGSTTIRDIAGAAHISTGLLFHYFPSKQALLFAHLEFAADGIKTAINVLESGKPPLHTFYVIADITLKGVHDPVTRLLYVLLNQPLPTHTIPAQLQETINRDHIITSSALLIKKGQQLGEIKPGDPRALAVVFWGAVQGVAEVLTRQPKAPVPEPGWLVDILKA